MSRRFLETCKEGKEVEQLLLPFLETKHGKLQEQEPTSVLDFKGLDLYVEIKSRSPEYTSTDKYSEGGWFFGYNKVQKILEIAEPVYIYYYFRGDKTLWTFTEDKEKLRTLKPFKNFQQKLTVKIPKSWFSLVPVTA